MALLDDVRVALRVVSEATDSEIEAYIQAAIEEMRRVGVRDELLVRESLTPLAKSAVIMYCKANYGFGAGNDATMFWNCFNHTVMSLKLSRADEVIYADLVADGTIADESEDSEEPEDDQPDDGDG